MLVRAVHAVHKAVRNGRTHFHGVNKEKCSKLFEAMKMVDPVVDDGCEEPALDVCVRPDEVCGFVEQMAQISLPATMFQLTEEEG